MPRYAVPGLLAPVLLALAAAGCKSIPPDPESLDPDSRRRAAEDLAGASDAASLAQLRRLLADSHTACPSHPHVRGAAARSLGLTGRADVVPDLAAVLEKDPVVLVRADAATALGDLGIPAAAPPLRAALLRVPRAADTPAETAPAKAAGTPDEKASEKSPDKAAGTAPGTSPAGAVPAAVAGEAFEVRRAAARSLGRLRDTGSVPALVLALADPDKTVRLVAHDSLVEILEVDKGYDPTAWK
jgi:HEAT repeat protein